MANSVKFNIDLLEKQAKVESEYRSNLHEGGKLTLSDENLECKDPFVEALYFVRNIGTD